VKKLLQIGGVLVIVVVALPTYWSGNEEESGGKAIQEAGSLSEDPSRNRASSSQVFGTHQLHPEGDVGKVSQSNPTGDFIDSGDQTPRSEMSERVRFEQIERNGYTVRWISRAGMVPVIRKFKAAEAEKGGIEWLADSLIVTTQVSMAPDEVLSRLSSLGITDVDPLNAERTQWRVTIAPTTLEDFFATAEQIKSSSIVASVGNNFIFKVGVFPNDPLLPLQYGFGPVETTGLVEGQKGLGIATAEPEANLKADQAWESKRDCSSISVGVIDSGIDSTHPDLRQNLDLARSRNFVSDAFLSDDCTQRSVAIPNGNITVDASKFNDENGHGTHVAGTIGALGNNGVGVSGVCWNAKIVTIRTMNKCGRGSSAAIIAGINYAAQNKIRVVNMSLGGGVDESAIGPDSAGYQAIAAVGNAGGLVIAAAGNESTDNAVNFKFPASIDHPALISVASHNVLNQISSYSNFSRTNVHIAAPGEAVVSTVPVALSSSLFQLIRNSEVSNFPASDRFKQAALSLPQQGYDEKSGTSMAAPHVAGVAALIWSLDPGRTNLQLKELLYETADRVPEFESRVVSGRRVNLGKAMRAAEGLSVRLGNETGDGRVSATVAKQEPVYVRLSGEQVSNFAQGDLLLGSQKIGECSAFDGTCVGRIPSSSSSELSSELSIRKGSQELVAGMIRVMTLSESNGLFGSGSADFSCRLLARDKVIASFKAKSREGCMNVCRVLSSRSLDSEAACSFGGGTESIQAGVCNAPVK